MAVMVRVVQCLLLWCIILTATDALDSEGVTQWSSEGVTSSSDGSGSGNGSATCVDPTPSELTRSLTHSAHEWWAEVARKQKSVRVMCMGGSNTFEQLPKKKYPELLDDFLKEHGPSGSYANNEGKPGVGPNENLGDIYTWEEQPPSQWPNVITLEFSINAHPKQNSVMARLIAQLSDKYTQAGVPFVPAFLFIDLFALQPWWGLLPGNNKVTDTLESETMEDRKQMLEQLQNYGARNAENIIPVCLEVSAEILAFSRFHDYPMVSTFDVLFPSFKRWFLETSGQDRLHNQWKYTDDYVHLSILGHDILANKIIGPFLLQEYRRKPSTTSVHTCPSTAIISPTHTSQSVMSRVNLAFTSWHPKVNTLKKSVLSSSSPSFSFVHTLYHDDDAHRCFGSNEPNSHADFQLFLPKACDNDKSTPCRVVVAYLASWNTSYTGDTTCALYKAYSPSNTELVGRATRIYGNGTNVIEKLKSTGPMDVVIQHGTTLRSGRYVLRCVKDTTHRLGCVAGIKITN